MKSKQYGILVGKWLYKQNITYEEAETIEAQLKPCVTNVAIIQTKGRRKT